MLRANGYEASLRAIEHNSGLTISAAVPAPIARLLAWLYILTGRQNIRICRVGGVLRRYRLTTGRAGGMLAAVTGTADHCGAAVRRGTGWRRSMRNRACAYGRSLSPRGTSGMPPRRGLACFLLIWGSGIHHRWGVRPQGDRGLVVAKGYLKMPSGAALQELLAGHQISLTSVHASVFDLRRLVGALGAQRIVPIHFGAGYRCCAFSPGTSVTLTATGGRPGPNDRATRPRAVQLG